MTKEPEAVEGFVTYEPDPNDPDLREPAEAEALALSLLGAASEARSHSAKEQPYHERNLAVAALLKTLQSTPADVPLGHDDPATEYQNTADGKEWRLLWCNHPAVGQLSWHVEQKYIPESVPARSHHWDGHTTDEKNRRVAELADAPAAVDDEQSDEPPTEQTTSSAD